MPSTNFWHYRFLFFSGGGKVDPDPRRGGWTEAEQEFGEVDTEFWRRIGAAWSLPRNVPGGGGGTSSAGAPSPLLLPMVVNFGHGVGNAWRIQGEEVAVFGRSSTAAAAAGEGGGEKKDEREGFDFVVWFVGKLWQDERGKTNVNAIS